MSISGTDIISHLKNLKNIHIVFSIDLDAIITSSMLMRLAREEDIEVYLAPFYSASKPIDTETSVLLVKVLQRTPIGGLRIEQIDDILRKDPKVIASTAMYLLRELKKHIVVPRYLELISLVAMLSLSRGSTYDKNLFEIHKSLINEAIDKNLFTITDTLRLFGYPRRDVIDALVKTVDPYVVGVSLDYEGSKQILESIGGSIINEEAKTKLAEIITSRISSYCKICEPIIGSKIVIKDAVPIDDAYEAVYMFYSYMDVMGVEPLIYLGIDSKIIEVVKGVFDYISRSLKNLVDHVIERGNIKKIIVKGIKLSVIDISSFSPMPPLYTAHRVLRALNLTEDITIYSNDKEYFLPLPFIAPRWLYDKELNIEKGYAIFKSLQELGDVFR